MQNHLQRIAVLTCAPLPFFGKSGPPTTFWQIGARARAGDKSGPCSVWSGLARSVGARSAIFGSWTARLVGWSGTGWGRLGGEGPVWQI